MTSPSPLHTVLPLEILELCYQHFDTPTLGRCMSVSRQSYSLAVSHLYRKIVVDLTQEVNPLFYRGLPTYTPAEPGGGEERFVGGETKGKKLEVIAEGTERGAGTPQPTMARRRKGLRQLIQQLLRRDRCRHLPIAPFVALPIASDHLPMPSEVHSASVPAHDIDLHVGEVPAIPISDRFSFIRHLTITSHNAATCAHLPPLILPHLHTIRILSAPGRRDLSGCQYDPRSTGYGGLASPCTLLSRLRPRRVVLGGIGTCINGTGGGIWGSHSEWPPSFVQELVVYMGNRFADQDNEIPSFLSVLPSTIERLTLIDLSYQPPEAMKHTPQYPNQFWERLAEVCAGSAQMMEVVGVNAERHEMMRFQAHLEDQLMLRGWMIEEVATRAEGIIFTPKAEYDQREGVEAQPRAESSFVWERRNHLRPLSDRAYDGHESEIVRAPVQLHGRHKSICASNGR